MRELGFTTPEWPLSFVDSIYDQIEDLSPFDYRRLVIGLTWRRIALIVGINLTYEDLFT